MADRQILDQLVEQLQIEGWCRPAERAILYELARAGPAEGAIVEIGAWQGLSTIYLAAGSKHAGRERVTTIDPFPGDNHALLEGNLRRAGVADWVTAVAQYSTMAARQWAGPPIRLLFLDGDHAYEQVMQDYRAWQQFVAPGGLIVFHDALEPEWPGVSRALDELLLTGEWVSFRVVPPPADLASTESTSDPVLSSLVVAQRRGGSVDLAAMAGIGGGVFVALREAYAQLREQRTALYLLRTRGATPAQTPAPDTDLGRLPAPDEHEQLIARARTLEGQYHQTAQYARELEDQLAQAQAALAQARHEHERVAAANRALGAALRAANPIKQWLRARAGRGHPPDDRG